MDPNACFSMILECLADEQWNEAAEHASSLQSWLAHGGFSPGDDRIRKSALNDFLAWLVQRSNFEKEA